MKNNEHSFIVKIIDDFIDASGYQCIVQNYYEEGDFKNFLIKRDGRLFKEGEITQFLANIIIVVHHLNQNNIYHRDLKPDNFLLKTESNGKTYLYLTDFGCAKNNNPDYNRI